jgi:hypothetical protein
LPVACCDVVYDIVGLHARRHGRRGAGGRRGAWGGAVRGAAAGPLPARRSFRLKRVATAGRRTAGAAAGGGGGAGVAGPRYMACGCSTSGKVLIISYAPCFVGKPSTISYIVLDLRYRIRYVFYDAQPRRNQPAFIIVMIMRLVSVH